jgi:hypothetical protein
MEYLTQEIETAIKKRINSFFIKCGLIGIALIALLAFAFYFVFKIGLERANDKFTANLEKEQNMKLELWNQQKDLMFDFVTFLEDKIFNNPNLDKGLTQQQTLDEYKKVNKELNIYYAKLYLVMETPILEKINEYIKNDISNVQRYYLYK